MSAALALSETRGNATVLASILLEGGKGDAMMCGVIGRTADHLTAIRNVIGYRDDVRTLYPRETSMESSRNMIDCAS